MTARYSPMATRAAHRLGLAPTVAQLDRPAFPGDGRDTRAEAPETHSMHSTRGYRREHRPDRNPVRLDLGVAQQAGIPRLMPPRSGKTREALTLRPVIPDPMAPRPITYGTAYLVAASALGTEEHLQP